MLKTILLTLALILTTATTAVADTTKYTKSCTTRYKPCISVWVMDTPTGRVVLFNSEERQITIPIDKSGRYKFFYEVGSNEDYGEAPVTKTHESGRCRIGKKDMACGSIEGRGLLFFADK
jgi:hypothetical protein